MNAVLFVAPCGAGQPAQREAPTAGRGGISYAQCAICPAPRRPSGNPEKRGSPALGGMVILRVLISELGAAREIQVVQSVSEWLDQSAIEAVRGWRFRPSKDKDGKAVAAWNMIEVSFRLNNIDPGALPAKTGSESASLEHFSKTFAGRLAQKLIRRIVFTPRFECRNECVGTLALTTAAAFSSALAETGIVKLVSAEEQRALLVADGFLPIDVHLVHVVRYTAHRANADAYVSGQMQVSGADFVIILEARVPDSNVLIERQQIRLPSSSLAAVKTDPVQDATGAYMPGFGGVTYPKCLKCPRPAYSERAYEKKLQGIIVFVVTVDANGRLGDPRPIVGMPEGLLERALTSVRGWTFQPGELGSTPVPTRVELEVSFRLH